MYIVHMIMKTKLSILARFYDLSRIQTIAGGIVIAFGQVSSPNQIHLTIATRCSHKKKCRDIFIYRCSLFNVTRAQSSYVIFQRFGGLLQLYSNHDTVHTCDLLLGNILQIFIVGSLIEYNNHDNTNSFV